jgi:hypothetical protein
MSMSGLAAAERNGCGRLALQWELMSYFGLIEVDV